MATTTLAGFVHDESGNAVSAATVEFWTAVNGIPGGAASYSTTTDSDGFWTKIVSDAVHYDVKIAKGTKVRWIKGLSALPHSFGNYSIADAAGIPLSKLDSTTVAGVSATQTLTNKTLTGPIIDTIKDANGASNLAIAASALAVNYFTLANNATGSAPQIQATSAVDSNISIDMRPKGTGRLQATGVNVLTVSSTDTVTNKNLSNGSVFHVDAVDETKKIDYQSSAAATGTATSIRTVATANRVLTLPDVTGTLATATAPTDWTPTFTQSGALTCTVSRARWQIVGKMAHVFVRVIFTNAGTAGTAIKLTNIPAAIAPAYNSGVGDAVGSFSYGDQSVGTYSGSVHVMSTTELQLHTHLGTSNLGADLSFAVANTDVLSFTASWEVA